MGQSETLKEVRGVAHNLRKVAAGLIAGIALLDEDAPIKIEGMEEGALKAMREMATNVEAAGTKLGKALSSFERVRKAQGDLFIAPDPEPVAPVKPRGKPGRKPKAMASAAAPPPS